VDGSLAAGVLDPDLLALQLRPLEALERPFGLVGVESVLCGTPIVVADNVGCAEVVRDAGSLRFALADAASFERAIREAIDRWRRGTHRVADPHAALSYYPGVQTHLDALLRHAARISA